MPCDASSWAVARPKPLEPPRITPQSSLPNLPLTRSPSSPVVPGARPRKALREPARGAGHAEPDVPDKMTLSHMRYSG